MEAYALTDIGRVRTMNQDYIYSSPEKVGSLPNLFLVADGMGGHRAGDYASRRLRKSMRSDAIFPEPTAGALRSRYLKMALRL